MRNLRNLSIGVLAGLVFGVLAAAGIQAQTTERVSVASDGTEGNGQSAMPLISADGRYVAFESSSSNLVPGDTSDFDVFVHDRDTAITERVRVDPDGILGINYSYSPAISADGRVVAFHSETITYDPEGEEIIREDVFVHDRDTDVTERVNINTGGELGNRGSYSPAISPDGRYVGFGSLAWNLVPGDTNIRSDVFVRDRYTGLIERVSVASDGTEGDSHSGGPAISADGRFVAFQSSASNLVDADTNDRSDVFVHDRNNGDTERVSVYSGGGQGNGSSYYPAISPDGRFVAFLSYASGLTPTFGTLF